MKMLSFYKRLIKFLNSFFVVWKTCGFKKAVKRSLFILIQTTSTPKNEKIVSVNGLFKMSLIPFDRGISAELLKFKTHEPLTTKMLKSTVKDGWNVLDVGSNIGYYVLLNSLLVGKSGKIIATEPIPKNYKYLLKNIELNHLKNVKTLNLAISNKVGNLKMVNFEYSNWCKVKTNENSSRGITVSALTIDKLIKDLRLKKLNLIRMDIEGYEINAIHGAIKTIQRFHPDLLIEIHTKYLKKNGTKHFLNSLKKEGYEIVWSLIRDLDFKNVGSIKDIRKISINEFTKKPPMQNDIMTYLKSSKRKNEKSL